MNLFEVFHVLMKDKSDPRTKDWPLIDSIYQILLIIFIYLFVIFYWIPRFMKNKSPYKLTTFIKFYNVFQIVANTWLVREHIAAGWLKNIPFTCMPVIYSYELPYYKFPQILWWCLLLKIVDLTETIVFALRKKNKQISALHVYHHISTVMLVWIAVKYVSGEMATFFTFINCNVHVLMYTFYLLSAFGPHIQAAISPIKPYITIIQMVQFCVLIIYSLQVLLPNCNVSKIYFVLIFANIIINWYMFHKFYQKSYKAKVKQ